MKERARAGLRIPYEMNTWLTLEAERKGMSKNALILLVLDDWLRGQKERESSAAVQGQGSQK